MNGFPDILPLLDVFRNCCLSIVRHDMELAAQMMDFDTERLWKRCHDMRSVLMFRDMRLSLSFPLDNLYSLNLRDIHLH